MDKESIITQAEAFKEKYGEYPALPIRICYKWCTQKAEGDLDQTRFGGYSIFGFPGMIPPSDPDVQDLKMLYDAKARLFPNISIDDFHPSIFESLKNRVKTE